jgi:primosomal protein N' (replication factor Y)
LFDYVAPQLNEVGPGQRVLVPFGSRELTGLVMSETTVSTQAAERLRPIWRVLDAQPLFDSGHLAFLTWAADYYHHPLGEVIATALPARLRRGEPALGAASNGWELTQAGAGIDLEDYRRAPRQKAILRALHANGDRISHADLVAVVGACAGPLRALQAKGWVKGCAISVVAESVEAYARVRDLSDEQERALAEVRAKLHRFAAYVLDGVTGSGKTEVYIRLAEIVIARGESVLALIPEIALTPQLVRRFTQRLGNRVAVLHSGMGKGGRERAWHAARTGSARLVIGTRSAVLAPVPNLGLVVVDEEHDSSYKQQEGFRYSARDLAVFRAQNARGGTGCPVVLGSATPALETLNNVATGRYQELRLVHRAGGAELPRVDLLDIRDQPLVDGMSSVLFRLIDQTLGRGEQALVFLNRRGYAPVLTCFACGWVSDCPRCDARQTLHARLGRLWCHHCGSQRRTPSRCPQCGIAELHPLGQGTQRVETNLSQRYAAYPLLRIDRDAVSRRGSLERILEQARRGGPAILVGTQMLAKGHHLQQITLVVVLDVDTGLYNADFRATERLAQLLVQVAGRAGRGEAPGRVVIQTRFPEHPLLQRLVSEGYHAFAERALVERREARLPPYAHQALIRAEAHQPEPPSVFLEEAVALVRGQGVPAIALWGPAPAPMERRAGRYRAQLLLQADRRGPLHTALERLLPELRRLKAGRRVRWSLDVDPVDLL